MTCDDSGNNSVVSSQAHLSHWYYEHDAQSIVPRQVSSTSVSGYVVLLSSNLLQTALCG